MNIPPRPVVGHVEVYGPPPTPHIPAPPPPTTTGFTMGHLVLLALGLVGGIGLGWATLDTLYGGADIRALEARIAQSEAQQQTMANIIHNTREALQCPTD